MLKLYKRQGEKVIILLDVLFIGILEAVVIYSIGNSLLNNILVFKDIVKISLIYAAGCYLIRSYTPTGINMILIFLLYVLLYYLKSKVSIIKCLIVISIAFTIKFVSEYVLVGIIYLMGIDLEIILTNQLFKIIVGNISLIIPFLTYLFIDKKKIKLWNEANKKNKINHYTDKMLVSLSIINIVLMSGVMMIISISYFKFDSKLNLVILNLIAISVLCVGSLIIVSLILKKSKEVVQLENNAIICNLNQMKETIDMLRIQKHDYMNHLQVILMQVSKGKCEDARSYILGIAEDSKNSISVFETGSNYIDAILNFKSARCNEYNIQLTACIDSLLEYTPFQDTQLSAIFLNIIDNAIDELKQSEKEYKYIHVDTYIQEDKDFIAIKNNGIKIQDIQKIFENGYSSKGENRGYGLYSIKQMLLNHKCNIEVYSDDDETEFIIELINLYKNLY
ncbi:sensor histidine kinase [Romboutsia sp.]|uniref:sensor histidine kinase n=1 Tax=Romboutsia sp. TaxID=1965302 RepID=UPI003F3AB402